MKRILLFVFALAVIFSGSTLAEQNFDNEVVAKAGKEKITYGELKKAFTKNMNRKDIKMWKTDRDSLMDFLELYINYRLKVQDALQRGFDKDSAVIADIEQNKRILAESYLFEKKLIEPIVEEMVKRRKYEMQIAIMLFTFPPEPFPDTVPAQQKAWQAIERLKKDESFAEVAKDMSDDKETAKMGGKIPSYITSGKVQRPIEDAIYSLDEGEIYMRPIKTKYGYFVLKLLDKNPRIDIKASHILIPWGPDKDTASVIKKADSLLNLINKGESFEDLAREHSGDPQSAPNGGKFGMYYSRVFGFDNTGRHLVPEMEEALYKMEDGGISGKIFSEFGVHIVRRDSTKVVNPEDERDDVKKIYKRIYFQDDKRDFLDSIRLEYGFSINRDVLRDMIAAFDTTKTNLDSAWAAKVPQSLMDKTLFEIDNKKTKAGGFIGMMNDKINHPLLRGTPLTTAGIENAIDKLTDPVVISRTSDKLEKEYEGFTELLKEFRDGILLFKVEAGEVWDKLSFDTTLARKYYDTTKSRYKTDPIYEMSEIYVLNDSIARLVYEELKSGKDFDALAAKYTQRKGFREKDGKWGQVSAEDNALARKIYKMGIKEPKIIKPIEFEKGWSIVKIEKFEPVRQKTFEEAIPDFASEFQDKMQQHYLNQWISKLHEKFETEIYEEKLEDILEKQK